MSWQLWYDSLSKPIWTPPGQTIGAIWSVIYPLIMVAFVLSIIAFRKKCVDVVFMRVFGINILLNIAFTPVQFGLQNLAWATAIISTMWLSIGYLLVISWQKKLWIIGLCLVPYMIWVTIAGYLQWYLYLYN